MPRLRRRPPRRARRPPSRPNTPTDLAASRLQSQTVTGDRPGFRRHLTGGVPAAELVGTPVHATVSPRVPRRLATRRQRSSSCSTPVRSSVSVACAIAARYSRSKSPRLLWQQDTSDRPRHWKAKPSDHRPAAPGRPCGERACSGDAARPAGLSVPLLREQLRRGPDPACTEVTTHRTGKTGKTLPRFLSAIGCERVCSPGRPPLTSLATRSASLPGA